MPRLTKNLPIAPGGVRAELGDVGTTPRAPARGNRRGRGSPREQVIAPERPPADAPEARDLPESEDPEAPIRALMAIKPLPRRTGRRSGRIRWYHKVRVDGAVRNCWAFSIPRAAHEAWAQGEPLSAVGAIRPDGTPCVPKGVDPTDVPIRCGTCGTTTVEFLQLNFFEE